MNFTYCLLIFCFDDTIKKTMRNKLKLWSLWFILGYNISNDYVYQIPKSNVIKTSLFLFLSFMDKSYGAANNILSLNNTINNTLSFNNKTIGNNLITYSGNKIIDCSIKFGLEFSQFKVTATECKSLEKTINKKIAKVIFNLKNNKCEVDGIKLNIKNNICKNLEHFVCENLSDNSCYFIFDVSCNGFSCKNVTLVNSVKRDLEDEIDGRSLQAAVPSSTITSYSLAFNTCYLTTADGNRYADCSCEIPNQQSSCLKKCQNAVFYNNWTPAQSIQLFDTVPGLNMVDDNGNAITSIPFQQNDCIKSINFLNNICYLTTNDNSMYKQCSIGSSKCNSFVSSVSNQLGWYQSFKTTPTIPMMTPIFKIPSDNDFGDCFTPTMNAATNNLCLQSVTYQDVNGAPTALQINKFLNCYAKNFNECSVNFVSDFGTFIPTSNKQSPSNEDCTITIVDSLFFNNICYLSNSALTVVDKSWFKTCSVKTKLDCDGWKGKQILIKGSDLRKVSNFNELDCFNWETNMWANKIVVTAYNGQQYLSCNIPTVNLNNDLDASSYVSQKEFFIHLIEDKEKMGLCPLKFKSAYYDNALKICRATDFKDISYTLCAYSERDCNLFGSTQNLSMTYSQYSDPRILQWNNNLLFNEKDCPKNTTIIKKNYEDEKIVDCCVSVNTNNKYLIVNSTKTQCTNLAPAVSLNNIDNADKVVAGCDPTVLSSNIIKVGTAVLGAFIALFI